MAKALRQLPRLSRSQMPFRHLQLKVIAQEFMLFSLQLTLLITATSSHYIGSDIPSKSLQKNRLMP